MIGDMSEPILTIDDLHKSYHRFVALKGVSFSVMRGELFGLLGPNGAGKSTLLNILAGLHDAESGSVVLDGKPFRSNDRSAKYRIGIAPQDLAIYPELTASENLQFFGRMYGIRGTLLNERVARLLAAVGLSDRAHSRTETFSGGMKRRLNLAVAVIHEPELLLLDEPTTGVDPQSRNHIFATIRQLNANGMTIIYTSHYMEEVQQLCNRIAILESGEMLACDTLQNLLSTLEAQAKLILPQSAERLLELIRQLDGVTSCEPTEVGLRFSAENIALALPAVMRLCMNQENEPMAIDINQPTLERVFLHLTGRALRD